jgi:hypothetical protein
MTPSNTLRQAASAVFALTAVVPLLLFVWTVHQLGALGKTQAQIGLALALVVALGGFFLFRMLMGRMSDLIQAVGRVVELSERSASRAREASPRPVPPAAPAAAWARAAVGAHAPVSDVSAPVGGDPAPSQSPPLRPAAPAPPHQPATPQEPAEPARPQPAPLVAVAPAPIERAPDAPSPFRAQARVAAPAAERRPTPAEESHVPGLGAIREVNDLNRAMVVLWRAEAAEHLDRRVTVSVLNSARPIVGTLLELDDAGLLVETDAGERVTVSFDRISGIDGDEPSSEV